MKKHFIAICTLVTLILAVTLLVKISTAYGAGASKQKFNTPKPISGTITAQPATPGSAAIVTSTLTFNNEAGVLVGTLYPDNTFTGDIIETLRVIILNYLALKKDNETLARDKEVITENYYSLKKLVRESIKQ